MISAPPKLHVMHVPGVDPERDRIMEHLHTITDVCVHADPDRNGVMATWNSAVQCATREANTYTWHFITQDDMVPYRGWMQHLERACNNSPRPLLGLCWIGDSWRKGHDAGRPYMVGPNLLRGGAIAYHHTMMAPLARFADDAAQTDYRHDDMALCTFAQDVQHFQPALVSRTIFDSVRTKSLIGHARYDTGTLNIENTDGPAWSARPRYVQENKEARRDDEGYLLRAMGWDK